MKSLLSILLVFSTFTIGCGKDSGGGGGAATANNRYDVNNQDTAICATARYQGGRWFDYNGIELPQCRKIQNYMNSKYLLSYDNNNCMSRKYKKEPTYMVNLNGVVKCARAEYFDEFGNNQIYPQYGRTHYVGYAPPSYYHHQNNGVFMNQGGWAYRTYGRSEYEYDNGFYRHCYGWGCDIGDGKWNYGDFAAIALGAGLIFAIANQ